MVSSYGSQLIHCIAFVIIFTLQLIKTLKSISQITLTTLQEKPAPDLGSLTQHDYEHMLTLSNNQRAKYYTYLYKTHIAVKHESVCACFWLQTICCVTLTICLSFIGGYFLDEAKAP